MCVFFHYIVILVKIPARVTNERRERVWFLILKGYSPQSIIKTLHTTQTVVYNDIKFLTERSRKYVFDMAKGTHVLMYQYAVHCFRKNLHLFNSLVRFCLIRTCLPALPLPPSFSSIGLFVFTDRGSLSHLLYDCLSSMLIVVRLALH